MKKSVPRSLTLAFVFLQFLGIVLCSATPRSHVIEEFQRSHIYNARQGDSSESLIFDTSVGSSTPLSEPASSTSLAKSPSTSGNGGVTGLIFDTAVNSQSADPSESLAIDTDIGTPKGAVTTSLALPSGSPAAASATTPVAGSSGGKGIPGATGGAADITVTVPSSPTSTNSASSIAVSIGHAIGVGLALGASLLA
ncbi:hypothetical protein M422DRAFT_782720 [Sphaerobolus stellatus SS14]|uniref:Uncharacterized protein n=1 Tax=Sphaerobolus stellatus (strain SS14) TaxID=990650 RepID=A0A0C9VBV8_SPHS4|nr:hypothetical protein M422DRAFT_782720 [Sphaerobolus stellatus SS14]